MKNYFLEWSPLYVYSTNQSLVDEVSEKTIDATELWSSTLYYLSLVYTHRVTCWLPPTSGALLEKVWRISLFVTDDGIEKLYVT